MKNHKDNNQYPEQLEPQEKKPEQQPVKSLRDMVVEEVMRRHNMTREEAEEAYDGHGL